MKYFEKEDQKILKMLLIRLNTAKWDGIGVKDLKELDLCRDWIVDLYERIEKDIASRKSKDSEGTNDIVVLPDSGSKDISIGDPAVGFTKDPVQGPKENPKRKRRKRKKKGSKR